MKPEIFSPNLRINERDLFFNQTDPRVLYGEVNHMPLLPKVVPYVPLMDNYCYEGYCDIPITPSFNNDISCDIIPLDKVKDNQKCGVGVHCFVDDYTISRFVNNIYAYLDNLRKREFVIASDCSSYSSLPKMVNLEGIFLSRNITCFLHEHGIPTIPCYTFSTFDSVEYSMQGIPMNSTVAYGNHVIGRHQVQREIIEYAVRRLIEVKHPTRLLVYGEPLWFDVDVDIIYKESRIQKLRRIKDEDK